MEPITRKERRLLKKALSPTRACAAVERLAEPDEQVLAHLAGCPRCQSERALLAAFESAAPRPEEQAAVSWISMRLERSLATGEPASPRGGVQEPWWRRWFTFRNFNAAGLALATAMLAVAVSVGLREGGHPTLSPPSGTTATAFRSGELAALSPAGDLDAPPAELRWEPLASAAGYSVRVMEVDRAVLWSAETREPRAALPPEVLARVVPGKTLLWQVTARDGAGATLAESAVQRFRMRRLAR